MKNHSTLQTTPRAATKMNAFFHPNSAATQAMTGANATMPSVTPAEASAAGVADRRAGNHL